jgi:hypothetical protein
MSKTNKIINLYKELNEDEKIRLFLSLQDLHMRDHYDPSYKQYRIQAKNVYGKLLVDTVVSRGLTTHFYNKREATRTAMRLLGDHWKIYLYEPGRESYMSAKEIVTYRNQTFTELDIFEKL